MAETGTPHLIVIVGGGFCGTALAVNLLRQPPRRPVRIVLVERQRQIGCGVAFAPRAFPHLLNVPAARMAALPGEDASELIEFARARLPDAGAQSFLPRQMYGEYLAELLRRAQLQAPDRIGFERICAEVGAVQPLTPSGRWLVSLGTRQLTADQVVLACGQPPPGIRDYARDVLRQRGYVADPYRDDAIRPTDRAVLLIGTGLTMVDVALAAVARSPTVRLIALSRHGLLPQGQPDYAAADATVAPAAITPAAGAADGSADPRASLAGLSVRDLLATVRARARQVRQRGGDWRDVIGQVREVAPALWQGFDERERRRFLRHVRAYWDVHRHRMPPAVAARVRELRQSGQLSVRAGSVRQLCADGERIAVLWRSRGSFDTRELSVNCVVDCSGPDHRFERTSDHLLRGLLEDGLARADASGLGLLTGQHGALIGADGRPVEGLFYLGPMLRASQWEATAVGELRVRAQELARVLAQRCAGAGTVHPIVTARPPTPSPRIDSLRASSRQTGLSAATVEEA